MRPSRFGAVLLFVAVTAFHASAQDLVRVKRVVDGDTLVLQSGERVRLIGVDTPEAKRPNTPVQYFGKRHQPWQNTEMPIRLALREFFTSTVDYGRYTTVSQLKTSRERGLIVNRSHSEG